MQKQGRKRRTASVLLALVVWLCIGLLLPIVGGLYSSDTALHDSVVAAPRHSFTIARPVVLSRVPLVRLDRGTIMVVDATGRPTAQPVTEIGQQLPAGGTSHLLIENAQIAIGVPAGAVQDGQIEEQLSEALAPLVDALAAIRYENLVLRRTTVMVSLGGLQPEALSDVQATILLRRKSTTAIKGSGILRGQRTNFDIAVGQPVADAKGGEARVPLKVAMKAPLVELMVDGRIAGEKGLGFQGYSELSLGSVRQVARWFGAYWSPGPGMRNLTVKGQAVLDQRTLSFEQARFSIDGNEANGAIAIAFGGERPEVTGTLAFSMLDVGRYFFSSNADSQDGLSWTSLASSALTVPLGMHLDADVRVSVERGRFASFDFGRSAATVTLKDGRLLADIAELGIAGGQAGGQVAADFTGFKPRVSLRGRLERVDLGVLTTAVSGTALLLAPATVVVDLNGIGGTATDLLQSLTGKVHLTADGGRLGGDLQQLTAATKATGLVVGWPSAVLRGRTGFDRMDLKLIFRDGVALTEMAEATVGDSTWSVTGLVNLPLNRLDLRLLQSGAGAMKSVANPGRPTELELRGPWLHPEIKSLSEPSSASGPGAVPAGPMPLPTADKDRG